MNLVIILGDYCYNIMGFFKNLINEITTQKLFFVKRRLSKITFIFSIFDRYFIFDKNVLRNKYFRAMKQKSMQNFRKNHLFYEPAVLRKLFFCVLTFLLFIYI